MTENKMFELLEVAENEIGKYIDKKLGDAYYVDDVKWDAESFERFIVPVWKFNESTFEARQVNEFYFSYDADDEDSAEEQVRKAVAEWLKYDLKYNH